MKQKTIAKIFLDAAMLILFILLMLPVDGDSTFFHVFAGILTGVLFVVHFVLNYRQFHGLFLSVIAGKAAWWKTALLVLDMLLPVVMTLCVGSGILIAENVLRIDVGGLYAALMRLHGITSYLGLGIMLTHLALHAKYLAGVARAWHAGRTVSLKAVLGGFAAACMTTALIYALAFTAYQSKQELMQLQIEMAALQRQLNSANAASLQAKESPSAATGVTDGEKSADVADVTGDGKQEDSTGVSGSDNGQSDTAIPTLSDFLGKLVCTGCGRRCLLTNPHCGEGKQQAQQATEDYYTQYDIVSD